MKKLLVILLVLCLLISVFTGCGDKKGEVDPADQATAAPTPFNPGTAPTTDPVDTTSMKPEEIFNFDPETNTVLGFLEDVVGVKDIVIPNEILGAEVKIIGPYAFSDRGLNSAVLPDTVVEIHEFAFQRNNLTEINIPSALKVLGKYSFKKNKLTEVVVPNTITVMESGVFSDNKLTKITLPDTITLIKMNAFSKNSLVEVVIPPLVTQIESYAFQDNKLENVVFNDVIKRIDGLAFSINNLTSITIPKSVEEIGAATEGVDKPQLYDRFTFAYNPRLTSITMLSGNVEVCDFFLGESNHFKIAYKSGGAGTYTGSQYGKWEKE